MLAMLKTYTEKEIEQAKVLLEKMRDNCIRKDTDAYDDPERGKKKKALEMALEGLRRLPREFGEGREK
jgi:hypothetical protein|nr:MAG TPA: hypothetical protein [Caudoviricetes sp.]